MLGLRWWSTPDFVNLVELCPLVSEVLTFEPRPRRFGKLELHIRALALAGWHLWQRQFDLALLPRWDIDYFHSAFVGYFSGARCRVGYSENVTPLKQRYDRGLDILFTRVLDDRISKHDALSGTLTYSARWGAWLSMIASNCSSVTKTAKRLRPC